MATPAAVDTTSFTPAQLAAFNSANALGTGVATYNMGASQTTPAAASVAPPQQMKTPAVPATQPAPQVPATSVTVNTGAPATAAQPATTSTATTQQPQPQPGLVMPANGSVVDLLAGAGQDSSYAARTQLAQQYGIQNYSGTAAQNQELSKKYIEAHNALKSTAVPQNPADARNAIAGYQDANKQEQQANPTQQFMDMYGSMNPIEANLYQQLSSQLSSANTQQSLTDTYTQLAKEQGIQDLNLQLADINKIMTGTEDDIRAEITNAGGFATESQVQGLVTARNKTLLTQANYLQNTINAKNDYVDRIVSLTQADRAQVNDDLDRKLGITNTLISMSQNMENNAKDNYKAIVDSVGWGGLAASLKDSPTQLKNVEKMFGLAPGELQSLAAYKVPLTDMQKAQLEGQQLSNQTEKLQQQKLKQDLNAPKSVSTAVVDLNGQKVLINSQTGKIISNIGAGLPPTKESQQQLAVQHDNIQNIGALLTDPGLNSAVGPTSIARGSVDLPFGVSIPFGLDLFTGAKSNFIGSVEQLKQGLTLTSLQNAKSNGATFGALSDSELNLLSQSATKLGSWAIKDSAGNVTGYNVDEGNFKKELDHINNFQKLDYVLKGGDPTSVGVQEQADGTFWVQNSDGSKTQIQ